MNPGAPVPTAKVARHSAQTIVAVRYWTPSLLSFRTSRPSGFRFTPGHYARLGLHDSNGGVVWRPLSVVSGADEAQLEFLVVLVPGGDFSTPLAHVRAGDSILLENASYGFMTIQGFAPGEVLWLFASGTGIGPFLSILRDAATWRAYRQVVLVHSVRHAVELAYRAEISALRSALQSAAPPAVAAARLCYVPVVTREHCPDALGMRIPQSIENGSLERAAGLQLDLASARIMVCGNPEMNRELRALLSARGFRTNRRAAPGQLAFENYWAGKPA